MTCKCVCLCAYRITPACVCTSGLCERLWVSSLSTWCPDDYPLSQSGWGHAPSAGSTDQSAHADKTLQAVSILIPVQIIFNTLLVISTPQYANSQVIIKKDKKIKDIFYFGSVQLILNKNIQDKQKLLNGFKRLNIVFTSNTSNYFSFTLSLAGLLIH